MINERHHRKADLASLFFQTITWSTFVIFVAMVLAWKPISQAIVLTAFSVAVACHWFCERLQSHATPALSVVAMFAPFVSGTSLLITRRSACWPVWLCFLPLFLVGVLGLTAAVMRGKIRGPETPVRRYSKATMK